MKSRVLLSTLEIKSVDEEKRIIEGIASTPTPDSYQDVVEVEGIEYALPLPFLNQHNSREPIGNVISATKSKDGLFIKAKIAADAVAPYIATAWAQIKEGLVRGLSIGFRPIEEAYNRETGGYHFTKIKVHEISAVTIAANSDCSILSVKSADSLARAAIGEKRNGAVRLDTTSPGVSGTNRNKGKGMKKSILEQITEAEAKIAANDARIDDLLAKSADAGSTPDAADKEEMETLQLEIKEVTDHIAFLKLRQARLVETAKEVTKENTGDPAKAAANRGGVTVRSNANLPKGTMFSRWVMAQAEAKGDKYRAPEIAKQFWPDMPEMELILRAGVNAGTTTHATWASPLIPPAQQMINEFIELLRPLSIIGRIQGLTRVPSNVVVPMQTGGGTGNWVGEGLPKPVSALAFSSVTLRWAKAVIMTVLSEELIRFSNPNAEALVRDSIAKDLAQFIDARFVSSDIASVNVSPAGILWNAPTGIASGVTAAAFLTDFKTALATFIAVNNDLAKLTILMSSTVALNVSTLKDSLGNFIYPTLNMQTGGSILGIPVVVSEAVGNKIIFLNAGEILLADDGGITIDASNQASILMDDAPNASPTTSSLVSLYSRNLVAIKCEQYIAWVKARASTAYFISSAAYTG